MERTQSLLFGSKESEDNGMVKPRGSTFFIAAAC